jgi:hypothetical protein
VNADRVPTMEVTFDESVAQFKTFLTKSGWPCTLTWIAAKDVLLTGSTMAYLRLPATAVSESRARQQFEADIGNELGVLLAALCKLDSTSYCYIWKPSTELEAQYALLGKGLKMSIPQDPLVPRVVRSKLKWWILWLRYRHKQSSKEWLFR